MEKFLETGKIVAAMGLKGEVKVEPWCDSPRDICGLKRLFFSKGKTELEVERARVSKNMAVIKLRGIDDVDAAQGLRGRVLYVDRDDLSLPEGSYFVADLIGMKVADFVTGEVYGVITNVTETGANDVYHIKDDSGKMKYVPAIPDVVKETDVDAGEMKITPLRGLFDED